MRVILGVVLALAVAYGGYWFVGSRLFERGVQDWFAAQAVQGRVAEHEGLAVTGFPSRFDLTVDAPHIADPQTGWGWRADFAQMFMLSYKPNHVIVALPDAQVLETPFGEVAVTGTGVRGSARMGLNLAPVRLAATGQAMHASLPEASLGADSFRFGSQLIEGRTHDVGLEADGLAVTAPRITLTGGILRLRGTVTLTEPVADAPLIGTPMDAVSLTEAVLQWGALSVGVAGDLVADAEGFASGMLNLKVQDWPAALQAAVEAGIIADNQARTLEGGFRMMSQGDTVEMPLTLAGGVVRFGPLPLMDAPRMK